MNCVLDSIDILVDADVVICKYQNISTTKELTTNRTEIGLPKIASGVYDRIDFLQAFADGMVDHSAWNKLYKRQFLINNAKLFCFTF
jgi:hypothetical protein